VPQRSKEGHSPQLARFASRTISPSVGRLISPPAVRPLCSYLFIWKSRVNRRLSTLSTLQVKTANQGGVHLWPGATD